MFGVVQCRPNTRATWRCMYCTCNLICSITSHPTLIVPGQLTHRPCVVNVRVSCTRYRAACRHRTTRSTRQHAGCSYPNVHASRTQCASSWPQCAWSVQSVQTYFAWRADALRMESTMRTHVSAMRNTCVAPSNTWRTTRNAGATRMGPPRNPHCASSVRAPVTMHIAAGWTRAPASAMRTAKISPHCARHGRHT